MRFHPSRIIAMILALVAAAWAFVLLPPQQRAWSELAGFDATADWQYELSELPAYDAVRAWLVTIGLPDFYLVFGAAASVSFLLIWVATGPAFAALEWYGRVLGGLVLVGAGITLLSYLNHTDGAPLRGLWGVEAFVLLAIGAWALIVSFNSEGVAPEWERAVLAATLPILFIATQAFGYWPHGSLIGLGLEAAVLAAWGVRADSSSATAPAVEQDSLIGRDM